MRNLKATVGIAGAVLLLALTGCSASGGDQDSAQARSFAADSTPEAAGTPTPTETPWPYTEVENGEATFLSAVKSPYTINGIDMPDDEQLLADAREACRQLAAGATFDSVAVIADDPNPAVTNGQRVHATNSRQLAGLASETLCTEYSQLTVPPPAGPDGQ